jgi:uncharacterized protein (DUF58 family)
MTMRARTAAAASAESDRAAAWFDEAFLRKLEQLALIAKRVARGGARGERKTARAGGGLEFADHRDYAPGDDPRRIDWNAYGRLERPLVRLFEAEEELPLYLLVDSSGSMAIGRPPKLELAAKVAAALAYLAMAALDPVYLYPFADGLDEEAGRPRGRDSFRALLGRLGRLAPRGQTDLDAAVTRLLARHRRRGLAVVLSDLFSAGGCEAGLERLRHARFQPVVLAITATEDRHAPADEDDLVVVDAETGVERRIELSDDVRLGYERAAHERLDRLERFCRRRALLWFAVSSEQPFDTVVLRMLRAGGLVT